MNIILGNHNPSFHFIFHFLFHLILHYWGANIPISQEGVDLEGRGSNVILSARGFVGITSCLVGNCTITSCLVVASNLFFSMSTALTCSCHELTTL